MMILPALATGYRAWISEGWEQIFYAVCFAFCAFICLVDIYFLIAKRGN